MKTELTKKILLYQQTGKNFSDCISHASQIAYFYPQKKYGWDLENCSDFFSDFFPKLKKIIKNFSYNGRPFEVLLYKYIKYSIKTFINRRNKKIRKSILIERNFLWHKPYHIDDYDFEELYTVSDTGKTVLDLDKKGIIKEETTRKRFLYIILKNMSRIPEKMKKTACRMMNMHESDIDKLMDKLNPNVIKRKKRLEDLKEIRNSVVSRILEAERDHLHIIDEETRTKNQEKIFRLKRRLEKIIYEISKVNISPTYSEIAEVLDTPKGTVDSGVYNFRQKILKISEKQCS